MEVCNVKLSSGKSIGITLGSVEHVSTEHQSKKELASYFLRKIQENSGQGCIVLGKKILFGETKTISLSAQILEFVDSQYRDDFASQRGVVVFENCRVVCQIGDMWYMLPFDDLGAPILEHESLTDRDSFIESLPTNALVYTVGDTNYPDAEQLDIDIHLEGDKAKAFTFKPDSVEFGLANLPHPSKKKRLLAIAMFGLFISGLFGGYQYYLHLERIKAAEAKAQKIPPALISSDVCAAQVVSYANYISNEAHYLLRHGLSQLAINFSVVTVKGNKNRFTHLDFIEAQRSRNVEIQTTGSFSDTSSNNGNTALGGEFDLDKGWTIEKYDMVTWPAREMFGYRDYEGYLGAIDYHFSRMNLSGFNLPTPAIQDVGHPEHKIKEGVIKVTGYLSPDRTQILHDIANALVGIPATCDSFAVGRTDNNAQMTFGLEIKLRGI